MTTHSETGSFDLSALNNLNQNLTQYFWFEEGGEGSYPWGLGAHVTLYPQSDFTNPNDSNYLKGQNILINTDGFSLRNGTIPLMVLDNDSLDFNLITNLSQGTYVNIATFGTNGATIGQLGGAHSVIDANGQRFYASDGTTLLANIGYGEGESQSGTAYAPFYSLGERFGDIGNYSVAEGNITTASGYASHAEGESTTASGMYSHAEGFETVAKGDSSHAEGGDTLAIGDASHAEGDSTAAIGDYSHAGGNSSSAWGAHSFAHGYRASATANCACAYGYMTEASGVNALAHGYYAKALHESSHASGEYTKTSRNNQTVIGQFNADDSSALFIIGNGTSGETSGRKNALTVDASGNVNIASGAKYKINGTALSASDVGAVPTSRTVNNKALSSNITLTASNVGALATSGGDITGNLSYKSSTIDASLANNGVSSTQYPTTFNILDKSNRILTRKEAIIESNGNISAYWYVRNYNTSGSQVGQKGIKITMNKSGTVTYAVDEPSKFLSAISGVPTSRTVNSKALSGNITLSAGDVGAVAKSVCCYANSRVDTFSNGQVSIPLANFGITNGAKPVGVLMTYQDGGAAPTILRYDYDASNSTNVIIKAYNSSGGAVSGAVRYFAMVFQGSWTKP